MGMNIVEKIMARSSGRSVVRPGDLVVVKVETAVLTDMAFIADHSDKLKLPKTLHDPDKVIIINDHITPPKDRPTAEGVLRSRTFALKTGVRFHDIGANQGICHQVLADHAYALPGTVLVCGDSHSCSSGSLNCCARGLGTTDILYTFCTGETWFKVGETVRYEFTGELQKGVSAKDVFLYIAGKYGDHVNCNIEFGGPAADSFSLDARRTLSTMAAEVSVEFAVWEPNAQLAEYVKARNHRPFQMTYPDPDAVYLDVRTIDLCPIEPYVALPDKVINNTVPVSQLGEKIKVDQCCVGSCANSTLEDLEAVAEILKGRKIADRVRFLVTPGSQVVYREAAKRGIINILIEAGCLLTPPTCGVCAGLNNGVLAGEEVCITATTRNFKGRMGSNSAKIYLGSPAVIAASAVTGHITDPRGFLEVNSK